MKITIDISIEEIMAMKKTTEVDYGYTVDQYDGSVYDGTEEVYKGYKIYRSNKYYVWCTGKEYETHSELMDTVDECRAQIDDHIIRKDI